MKNLAHILETATYRASLVLIGSVPGLFISLDASAAIGSVNRLIGGVVFLLWFLSILSNGRLRRLLLFHLVALGFGLWYVISLWWSIEPDDTPFLINMVEAVALSLMLWDVYQTRGRVESGMQAFLLGGYVSVGSTVFNFVHGMQARHWEKRFAGSGFDPNDIALLLAIGIPMAAYLASKRETAPFLRFLNFLYPVATALVIVLSGSRGALLAAAPGVLFYFLTLWRLDRRWRPAAIGLLIFAAVGATQLDLSEPLGRLGSIGSSAADDHLSGRADIWRAGWIVYGQHPVLGIGGGAFLTATEPVSKIGEALIAHNTYLSVLTELGPIGLFLFAAVLFLVVSSAVKSPAGLRGSLLTALLIWAVGVFALSWEFRSQTWFLFALIVAAGHAREQVSLQPAPAHSRMAVLHDA